MIDVDVVRVDLPLKKKFATSAGETSVKTNFIVLLNNRYPGEAAPSVASRITVEELEADIQDGLRQFREFRQIDLSTLRAIEDLQIGPLARAAAIARVSRSSTSSQVKGWSFPSRPRRCGPLNRSGW